MKINTIASNQLRLFAPIEHRTDILSPIDTVECIVFEHNHRKRWEEMTDPTLGLEREIVINEIRFPSRKYIGYEIEPDNVIVVKGRI